MNYRKNVEFQAFISLTYIAIMLGCLNSAFAISISPSSATMVVGASKSFSASGGTAPYTFSASLGNILNATSNPATFIAPLSPATITVSVKDAVGQIASASVSVVSKLVVTPSSAQLETGSNYSITPQGGLSPYSYSLSGVGSLSGAVYSAGSSAGSATVTVKDALNQSATLSLSIVVPPPPPIAALGSGIASAYAPNCTPIVGTDFIAKPYSAYNGRIEPADCTLVRVSTPIFSWTLPLDRSTINTSMRLSIKRSSDGYTITRDTVTPRLLLADVILSSGQYEWFVTYTNRSGVVVTSQTRKFVVASGTLFAIPNGARLATFASAKAHPRALPAGSDFATIASRAEGGEFKASYDSFITRANYDLTLAMPAVPANLTRADFASDQAYTSWLSSLSQQASIERRAIETLGYAAKFTGNSSYEAAGKARLMSLAAWPTTGATSEATQDQANREIYLALAQGIDLYYSVLTSSDRVTIVTALKDRLNQTIARFSGFDIIPYNSHLITCSGYATEALMHVAGVPEFPEAAGMLAHTWETMIAVLGAWGGSVDGGWSNGTGYGWFTMTAYVRILAATKLIANVNLSQWPTLGRFGDNLVAFTAPAAKLRAQFGDGVEDNTYYSTYTWDSFRLYAAVTGRPIDEWYWRADPKNATIASSATPYNYLMLGTYATVPAPLTTVPPMPDSWAFEDAGVVAMHSKSSDSLRSSVSFRSSRFGSYNHSHADHNSFTFVSKGVDLLISGGYYPYFMSPHHAWVGRATRFKNALTFDGGIGQAEPSPTPTAPGAPMQMMDASGKLLNFADNGVWAVTTGDATLAYRGYSSPNNAWTPLLSNAIRSVAYNRQEGVVVVYDFATSATARSWELNFQSLTAPTLMGNTVHIVNGTSSACIDIYGVPGSYAFTSGFPIPPEVPKPDQYQTRFRASAPSTQLVSVTVIRESCRTVPVNVSISGTGAAISINNGSLLLFNQKTITSH